jgi:hypothetical protein
MGKKGHLLSNLLHGDRDNLNSASHPYLRYLGAAAAKNGDGTQREEDRGENSDLTPVHSEQQRLRSDTLSADASIRRSTGGRFNLSSLIALRSQQ